MAFRRQWVSSLEGVWESAAEVCRCPPPRGSEERLDLLRT